jgi:uncharacterized protein YpmB
VINAVLIIIMMMMVIIIIIINCVTRSFLFVLLKNQIKEDKKGGASKSYERDKMHTKF